MEAKKLTFNIIAAMDVNGVIGVNGDIPWDIPEDMKHFRDLTIDKTVVMGRKTWESLPAHVCPLPRRQNIVLTRNMGWQAQGAETAYTLLDVALYADHDEVFIMGGAEIYRLFLEEGWVERMYLTRVNAEFSGDTLFPEYNADDWEVVEESEEHYVANGYSYQFIVLEQKVSR